MKHKDFEILLSDFGFKLKFNSNLEESKLFLHTLYI
jgi:hypothetical protein